ncbi:MAG: hypothetical protein WCC12_21760 [Anaerolineales bacterium]
MVKKVALSYSVRMNELINLTIDVAEKRGLVLILTQDRARKSKTDLIANLILNGPLFVVSGDEWLPSFLLPRMIREHTTGVREILNRLRTVRASTCHRLLDSLANIPSRGEPILVMDLLHTFHDPDILLRTRLFRLRECCRELSRLALYRPVIVTVQEREGEDYEKLFPTLQSIADKILTLEGEHEQISQPALL